MNKEILNTLEFHEVRKRLAEMAPSSLSKKRALALVPETQEEKIVALLDETEQAMTCILREISTPLGETYDITDSIKKAEKRVVLDSKEFMDIAASLETYKKMHHYFEGEKHLLYPALEEKANQIIPQETLLERIHRVFNERGEINSHATVKLSRIRSDIDRVKNKIRKAFEKIIHHSHQESFFQDSIVTQRNGRYVVPIKEEYRYKFDGIVHDRSASGQTLFMEPMISVTLNNDLTELITAEKQEILEILRNLTLDIKQGAEILRNNCRIATELEFIFARGELAIQMNGIKAKHSPHRVLDLKNARHPLIDKNRVVPMSIQVGKDFHILVITGSNAGGKTIAIKTAGLLALMNQSGLFIPAEEGSTLPVYHEIYAVIGDDQSIQYNLSTFSGYVTQLLKFLPFVQKKDLVLLDELGTGTAPIEGAALAEAITEYLKQKKIPAVITSHFSEMKKMAYETDDMENAFVEFDPETLTPTYRLLIGGAGNSNAFNICRRLGMSDDILVRADELQKKSPLHHMEQVMEQLNTQIQSVEQKKIVLEENLKHAQELKKKLERETEKVEERKNEILEKARAEAQAIKRDLKIQSEQIIKELKKKSALLQEKIPASYIEGVRQSIEKMKVPESKNYRAPAEAGDLVVGAKVYVDTLNNEGEVRSVSGNKVTVACGIASVTVHKSHCFKANTKKSTPIKEPKHLVSSYPTFHHAAVATSLNVIGKTVNEAIPLVDQFLNDCFMAGVSPVDIIHGKGTGSLRKGIQAHLRTLNFIREFKMASPENGGAGVTEVYL